MPKGDRNNHEISKKRRALINSVANPELRNILFKESLQEGGENVCVGKSVFFYRGSNLRFGRNVCIGENVSFMDEKMIKIGNNVWIGEGTIVYSGVEIGDNVWIAPNSMVHNSLYVSEKNREARNKNKNLGADEMYIEHLAILTKDLEKMREFYEKYFKAKSSERYHNKKTSFQSYFLTFESGSRLELTTKKFVSERRADSLGYAHLAISVGTQKDVDDFAERFVAEGYPLVNGPRTTGDGYYEAVIQDPEGNLIELTTDYIAQD